MGSGTNIYSNASQLQISSFTRICIYFWETTYIERKEVSTSNNAVFLIKAILYVNT